MVERNLEGEEERMTEFMWHEGRGKDYLEGREPVTNLGAYEREGGEEMTNWELCLITQVYENVTVKPIIVYIGLKLFLLLLFLLLLFCIAKV